MAIPPFFFSFFFTSSRRVPEEISSENDQSNKKKKWREAGLHAHSGWMQIPLACNQHATDRTAVVVCPRHGISGDAL